MQNSSCRHHQRMSASKFLARQRHNATQTPESALQSGDWSQRFHGLHQCNSAALCCHCCSHSNNNFCRLASAINTTTTHTATCFQHQQQQQQRRSSRDINCLGDIKASSGDMTCHCHITHHCHQHFSPSVGGDGGSHGSHSVPRRRHHKRRREHCSKRRHYQPKHHQPRHLPLSTTKSSLSSDDQLDEHPHRSNWHHGTQTQEIAIEIDAATTTLTDENSGCNSSTGTSNFSYKLAKDTNSQLPIILAPLHDTPRCRHSLNSNTTLETSELTADESSNDGADFGRSIKLQCQDDRGESPIFPPPLVCCEDPQCCRVVAAAKLHNECVKIKRKRFISQQYCSSCSKCSSCSCQMRTSSCSSLDDFEADLQEFDAAGTRKAHELTVSADCHRCQLQRQSTNSTVDDDEHEPGLSDNVVKMTKRSMGTDSDSARTSRRSSRESFCSCNSTSCCYCSCSCEEYDACHARHYAQQTDGEADQHSSTLTPVTQPSTPMGDEAPTLRSNSAGLTDESPSLSQSAEYFSLSSNQQSLQQQIATVATPELITPPRKQCKHYSKHHRHKPDASPMKSYL